MKKLYLVSFLLFLALVVGVTGAASIDPDKMMTVKELKAGMRGVGKTVFKGTKVEEFRAEIIGILEKANIGGGDLILVRCAGGPITERRAGVISGMSGSPVYINGKLIGAIAYAWYYSREAVAGVTPIADMLKSFEAGEMKKSPQEVATQLEKPLVIANQEIKRVVVAQKIEPGLQNYQDSNTMVLVPVQKFLMVSGMGGRAFKELERVLKPYNIIPIQAPSGVKGTKGVKLVPGSAVGIQLVRGDLDWSGVGTLTYVKGDKILAFGHGMMLAGAVDMSLTVGYVHDIMSRLDVSFKLSSSGEMVGRVSEDRVYAVAGELGKMPKLLPVSISVRDMDREYSREFNVEMVRTLPYYIFDTFATMAMMEAIDGTWEYIGPGMAKVSLEVEAKGVGTIKRKDWVYSSLDACFAALFELLQPVSLVLENPFQVGEIERMNFRVELQKERKTADIIRAFVDRGKVEPGETLNVGVVIRPFGEEPFTKMIKVKVPEDTPNGQLQIGICGGYGASRMKGMLGLLRPRATNLAELIKLYEEEERRNELALKVALPIYKLRVLDKELPSLPTSVDSVVMGTKLSPLMKGKEGISLNFPTEWVLYGRQILTVTVEKKEKAEKKEEKPPLAPPEAPMPMPPEEEFPEEGEEGPEGIPGEDFSSLMGGICDWATFLAQKAAEGRRNSYYPVVVRMGAVEAPPPEKGQEEGGPPKKEVAPKPEEKKEKPVGRLATVWVQTAQLDFGKGIYTNCSIKSTGDIELAPKLTKLYESAEHPYIWSEAVDSQGNLYAGSGCNGAIYKITPDGKVSTYFDSDELFVNCLLVDEKDNLYAGTAPGGILYRIEPDGKSAVLFDSPEAYIWCGVFDDKGNLYLGTGPNGIIYKVGEDGQAVKLVDLAERHVLALVFDKFLYAGTGDDGRIYKISTNGEVMVLYDSPERTINCLVLDKAGNLHAGSSPKGLVYKISPDGVVSTIFDSHQKQILSLAVDEKDNLFVGSGNEGLIFKIEPNETVTILHDLISSQVLSLIRDKSGSFYLGCGNPAAVYKLESAYVSSGSFESCVHDAGLLSKWGTISWRASLPEGTKITLQTRTGNSAEPDDTWSGWSWEYIDPSGEPIGSPGARYIQYFVNLSTEAPNVSPKLQDVSILYMPRNQPPQLKIVSPKGGERWSGKQTVKWEASDPDKDSLVYELYYSKDGGKTWEELKTEVKEEEKKEEKPKEEAVEEKEAEEFEMPTAEELLNQLPANMPEEFKKQIIEQLPQQLEQLKSQMPGGLKKAKPEVPAPKAKETVKETSFTWETKKYPDGAYLIKIIATDKVSNPVDAQTDEQISEPVILDNTPPKLFILNRLTKIADDKVTVYGLAIDKLSQISSAECRVDGGDWLAAGATDGIFDSKLEEFIFSTDILSKGEHKIEMRVRDAADNLASSETKVTIK